jgi:hypothetical protein
VPPAWYWPTARLKSAVEGLSKSVSLEVEPFGVYETLIEPASFSTDWSGASAKRATAIDAYEPVREATQRRFSANTPGDPALAVLNLYRRRQDMTQARALSDTCQVFEVAPLGYGYSDRVPGYVGDRLAEQVLRVLDHHDVDDFVVWGYSAGGAMALCTAQSTRG